MEQLLWECIYKNVDDNQIYAERFEATNAINALFQLSRYLNERCTFIPLGVKPILCSTNIRSQKYAHWLNDARKFCDDIEGTIRRYENELSGIIE